MEKSQAEVMLEAYQAACAEVAAAGKSVHYCDANVDFPGLVQQLRELFKPFNKKFYHLMGRCGGGGGGRTVSCWRVGGRCPVHLRATHPCVSWQSSLHQRCSRSLR